MLYLQELLGVRGGRKDGAATAFHPSKGAELETPLQLCSPPPWTLLKFPGRLFFLGCLTEGSRGPSGGVFLTFPLKHRGRESAEDEVY